MDLDCYKAKVYGRRKFLGEFLALSVASSRLGFPVREVEALKKRADDLTMGIAQNPNVQMQLDTGGAYDELPAEISHAESLEAERDRFLNKVS